MRYRVLLYNHQLPIDLQPTPVDVECDEFLDPGDASLEEESPFIIFVRGGIRVAMFRRNQVQGIYELSGH